MIYYMHKNPPFKYGKFPDAQCYNITPDENNRGYLIGTIFVIVKDNEIVAWQILKVQHMMLIRCLSHITI